jgi:hypothetical protein
LGPASFALALHPTLELTTGAQDIDWAVWYLGDGVLVGGEIGSKEAQQQFLGEVRTKHHALLEQGRFPDTQVTISLPRYCLGAQKINHLLRIMWSDHMATFVEET